MDAFSEGWAVKGSMQAIRRRGVPSAVQGAGSDRVTEFDAFLGRVEPLLRVALVATYGPVDGAVALGDAMSWAWEHFDTTRLMDNPVGYLYRVGQSSTRRTRPRAIPTNRSMPARTADDAAMSPDIAAAVNRLPASQRTAVMLVHAFGWKQRDVAELLGVTPSTVQQSLQRGIARLTDELSETEGPRP